MDIGCHPLGIVRSAERVFVKEAPGGGNVEAVEIAAAALVEVSIECRAGFSRLEWSNLRHDERSEIDRKLGLGDGQIAGDCDGIGTGGAPIAFVLSGSRKRTTEKQKNDSAHQGISIHPPSMTSVEGCEQGD